MRLRALAISILSIACGLSITAGIAQAAFETWVSGNGTDSGNCQITAPCRTFQFAHDQTNNNGALNVLSSGNFGPLTITKPISIVAQGVEALINTGPSSGLGGIHIEAGAGAIVSLRGLTIDMRGTDDGIRFSSGAALHVQDCVIRRASIGIVFLVFSGTGELYVADTVVANSDASGISVSAHGSASVKAVFDRVRAENGQGDGFSFSGAATTGSITATVNDSVAAGNGARGIFANVGDGTTDVMIDRSAVLNNETGVRVFTPAGADGTVTARIGNTTVSGNGTGLDTESGGAIVSYETNQVNGNGVNGTPSSTIAMK
jgi:hypothetical protein